ncbi:MAG: hypothetical protein IH905_12990 [Proteobacteria bacterium]|nr:hypothetical protein [Pseudomonadota bacterium]
MMEGGAAYKGDDIDPTSSSFCAWTARQSANPARTSIPSNLEAALAWWSVAAARIRVFDSDDRTSIIRRRSRVAFDLESYSGKDTMEVAGLVAKIINEEEPAKVFIDVGGLDACRRPISRDLNRAP